MAKPKFPGVSVPHDVVPKREPGMCPRCHSTGYVGDQCKNPDCGREVDPYKRRFRQSGMEPTKPTFREFVKHVLGEDQELPPHCERIAKMLDDGCNEIVISTKPRHGRLQAFMLVSKYLSRYGEEEE